MIRLLVAVTALILIGTPAFATAVTTGTWYCMEWDGPVGTTVFNCGAYTGSEGTPVADPGPAPWTYSGPATLLVTDLGFDGDQFNVFDNTSLIGTTSVPVDDDDTCGNDPVICFVDEKFSHGTFILGPGSHSITMTLAAEGQLGDGETGTAAFRLDGPTAVSEPSAIILLATGAGVLFELARRRRVIPAF
jgi:hypothetical protein